MPLTIWLNAFIPMTVTGYTVPITTGTNAGKTAVPLPGLARLNPLNLIKMPDTGYLTDQRGFSDVVTASVRMRSLAEIDVSGSVPAFTSGLHETSGTTEVDMVTGVTRAFGKANMSRCSWRATTARPAMSGTAHIPFGGPVVVNTGVIITDTLTLSLVGAAGDPLVWTAADIDYTGSFSVRKVTTPTPALVVSFDGLLDNFPAFEAYASLNGTTKTIFTSSPPAGNTVTDLLGGATRPVSGTVSFP
jgi:hypothetical protein